MGRGPLGQHWTLSDDTKTKMSAWQIGRKLSTEHRANISAAAKRRQPKHGHTTGGHASRTYNTWKGMIRRCGKPTHWAFEYYGGRGITVCERWHIFVNFLADMGERPEGMTLDRINSDGNYEPSNCKWSTPSEQQRNRRDNAWKQAA